MRNAFLICSKTLQFVNNRNWENLSATLEAEEHNPMSHAIN